MKAQAAGHLAEASVSPFIGEQVDIARVNAEIARAKMERDIQKKTRWRISRRNRCEIRLHQATKNCLADHRAMQRAGCEGPQIGSV